MDMEVSGTGIEMGVKIENGVRWNECLYMWWIREMRRMGSEIDSVGMRIWVRLSEIDSVGMRIWVG